MQPNMRPPLSLDVILPGIFISGILWGLLEVYLSPIIKTHAREMHGMIMPFFTSIIIIVAYNNLPKTGVIALMAVIAAIFEFFLAGMIFHGAFLAILVEGLIAELIIIVLGMNLLTMIITGILLQIYSMFHPLLTKGLFCQSSHFVFFKRWFEDHFMILNKQWLIFTLLSFHIVLGISSGIIGFVFSRRRHKEHQKQGLLF